MSGGLGEADRTHEDSEGRGCTHAGKWKRQGLEVAEGRVCEDPQGGGCWHRGSVQWKRNGALSLEQWTDFGI